MLPLALLLLLPLSGGQSPAPGTASTAAARAELQGRVLRGAVVLNRIEVGADQDAVRRVLVDHDSTSHLDSETRFGYALASHLAEMYNFTLQLLVTPSWGYAQPNGSFDGLMGMLQRGEVEMGVTPSIITQQRLDVADFTVQTWTLRSCFIFRHPRQLVPYRALIEPFDSASWLAAASVSALATLLLAAVRRCEAARQGAVSSSGGGGAVTEATLVVVGLLSQQGTVVDSALVSGRCVLLAGLVLASLLQSFYTSAIVTALLTPIPHTIRSVRDLMRSPLRVGLEDFSYNRALFQNASDPLSAELYRDKVAPDWGGRRGGGFFPFAEGVARVQRGGFAFFSTDTSLYTPIQDTFSDEEKCSLAEVQLNPTFYTAATLAKGSPYRELFAQSLLLMMERGLRARQRRKMAAPRPSCLREASTVPAVGLGPLVPAYAMFLLGLVATLGLLLQERCSASAKERALAEASMRASRRGSGKSSRESLAEPS